MIAVLALAQLSACEPQEENKQDALPTSTTRKVLHEVFTGSTCGPCYDAHAILEAVFADNEGKFANIEYAVGGDPYITSEGVSRILNYLPGETTYAIPYVHADGVNAFHPVEANDDEGYTQEDFDSFHSMPSSILLEVSHNVVDQEVSGTVTLTALADIESGDANDDGVPDLGLYIAINENTTTGNIGTNGLTEFHNVFKKMIPDDEGTPLESLARGDVWTTDFSYTFQGEYTTDTSISDPVDHDTEHTVEEFEDLSVVVFVQDAVTWEVLQAAWTRN